LERIYEKAENEEIIIPNKIGKFFPYYMKSKLADTFIFMMRQQNADMINTAVIPVFGYTASARQQRINIDGEDTTVELAVATTPDILRIEATPSTQKLHKYLVVVKKERREAVQKTIQGIFNKIIKPLDNQPAHFPKPRCGGRETTPESSSTQGNNSMKTAYMTKLETIALAQNPQDAGPSEPKRFRKITISYASAVKTGILKQPNSTQNKNNNISKIQQEYDINQQVNHSINSTTQRQVTWDGNTTDTSRSTGSSLSRSVTNSKMMNFKKDIDFEINELKTNLENRMDRQDQRIKDLIDVIHDMNKDLENQMASAVITTLVREKAKVQEITHGRTYSASEAPLAIEENILPFGPIAQSGGPLDRLHHVEITVQHMVSVLDSIAEHLQKDPAARHLFQDEEDDKSETSTIIANQQMHTARMEQEDDQTSIDNDVPMQMIKDYGGIKQLNGSARSPSRTPNNIAKNSESSPQTTPPPKRERKIINETSANPDGKARERGET
jgi:hypothetical protein